MVTKPQAKKAEYDRIRAKPFTRIHGRPTRNGVDRLASEAGDATLETQIPGYDWAGEVIQCNCIDRTRMLFVCNWLTKE